MVERSRSPLRFLAPIALIAATLIVYVVVTGSFGGAGEEEPTATNSAVQRLEGDRPKEQGSSESGPATYEIQSGDTLDAIAADTGVSAEKIQELNPDLDPQALIAGQELKLRE